MSTQIAVKLPPDVLSAVDRLVEQGAYESRAQAVRDGLNRILRESRSREVARAYRRGFERHPETSEELEEATRLAIESIHEEPWEPWW